MFDFLFQEKRKLALIRALLEQRMTEEGFVEIDHTIQIKGLEKFQLLSTPEATIVTIIETVIKLQKKGVLLHQILYSIESHRKQIGQNHNDFDKILKLSMSEDAGCSVTAYCIYRISLEHPKRLSENQVLRAVEKATSEFCKSLF